jgi:hypothetical protein
MIPLTYLIGSLGPVVRNLENDSEERLGRPWPGIGAPTAPVDENETTETAVSC